MMLRLAAPLLAAALAWAAPAAAQDDDTIFQYSTIDALKAGVFDGAMTVGEATQHGDFGLGTYNALDGEMIAFDGAVWRIDHNGVVHQVGPETLTPFIAVTRFAADESFEIEGGLDMAALGELLDAHLADRNTPVAIRIDGHFTTLKIRAPERQEQPYTTLAEALKSQAVWDHAEIDGTMVGFWYPAWLGGINAAAWHLHFLSADQQIGGHVLALETGTATVQLDISPTIEVVMPDTAAFAAAALPAE